MFANMIALNSGGFLLPFFLCSAFAAKHHDPVETGNKTVVRVKTILAAPYMMIRSDVIDDPSIRGNDRFHGYLADILKEWAERTDTEYHITVVRDGKYGSRSETGEWDGIIGEVYRRRADLGVAAISMTALRKLDVDFTIPWASVSLTMVMRRDLNIATPEELLQHGITFGIIRGGSSQGIFQKSEVKPYMDMWSKMASVNGSMVNSTFEGIRRAKEGNYVFIMENDTAAYVTHANCSLKMVGSFLPKEGYGFPVTKGSPLLEGLNEALSNMTRDGTLERLHAQWWEYGTCGTMVVRSTVYVMLLSVLVTILSKNQ